MILFFKKNDRIKKFVVKWTEITVLINNKYNKKMI
jgi:hypothetical protein